MSLFTQSVWPPPPSHLSPFESRNHYSNDDSPSLSLPLAQSNATLPIPNSELFSPAGTKKRHCGIGGIARRTDGRTEERIKLNFTLERATERTKIHIHIHSRSSEFRRHYVQRIQMGQDENMFVRRHFVSHFLFRSLSLSLCSAE